MLTQFLQKAGPLLLVSEEKQLDTFYNFIELLLLARGGGGQTNLVSDRLEFLSRLKIHNVQWEDAGIYICQLTVHPPALIWSRLDIVRPLVQLLDGDSNRVKDLHYDVGTTIEMTCRVKRPPLYHVTLTWEVDYLVKRPLPANSTSSVVVLNRDVTRGGVMIFTGRDKPTGQMVSQLRLNKARVSDVGNYTCRLSSLPPDGDQRGLFDTISVHVLQGENTEEIKISGQSRLDHITALLLVFPFLCCQIVTGTTQLAV